MASDRILTITVTRSGDRLQGKIETADRERAQVYMEAVLTALMVLGDYSRTLHELIGRAAEEARRRG